MTSTHTSSLTSTKSRASTARRAVIGAASSLAVAAALVAGPCTTAQAASADPARYQTGATDWATIKHPKRGFMIAYPASLFQSQSGVASEDGRAFVSPDGRARLLVGTFENTANFDLAGYRAYLLKENYTGARLDYERTKDRWFVISGVRGDTMFYERVSFTCGGRLVNSWAMLYPVSERNTYDRVVEAVARSYQPGAGATGNCD